MLKGNQGQRGRRLLAVALVAAAAGVGLLAWKLASRQPSAVADRAQAVATGPAPAGKDKDGARKPLTSVPNLLEPTGTADDVPVVPAGPDDPRPDGPLHFHPITPEHVRLHKEVQIIGSLNGAMDVKDVAAMRRLLKEYREKYPEDGQRLQSGYELIADCLEHPGEATRAAARRYDDQERGSILRRYVRRHCLE